MRSWTEEHRAVGAACVALAMLGACGGGNGKNDESESSGSGGHAGTGMGAGGSEAMAGQSGDVAATTSGAAGVSPGGMPATGGGGGAAGGETATGGTAGTAGQGAAGSQSSGAGGTAGSPASGSGGSGVGGTAGVGGAAAGAGGLGPETGLFVDLQIDATSCDDYDVESRSCGAGTETAYQTLAGAADVAAPGDTVLIREGDYFEELVPPSSGTASAPITYRNFQAEAVALAGDFSPAAIQLSAVSHVVIQGLTVADTRWLEASDAHHITLRNNTFTSTPATGTTGNVRFIQSHHNRIVGNTMTDGNDNLLLIDSDYNLVEGNTITEGRHSIWGIRCGDYNVIRNNFFANTQQKIGEVYDCGEDTSAVANSFDSTTHNLIEGNTFAEASEYYSTSGGNGIQYAGQDGLIRRNVFYDCNVGLGMQTYSDEAEHNERNRAVHNVFYANDCAGISLGGVDNVFKNNVLYQNRGVSEDCFGDGSAQLLYRNPIGGFWFERNDLFNLQPGEAVIQDEFDTGDTMAAFETDYPDLFADNLEVDPDFRDAANHDFVPSPGSQLIDAGAFLTRTVGAGSGTTVAVEDARCFYDGYGITGEVGDLVQLEGESEPGRVVSVDYNANLLELDHSWTWTDGQGVSLSYVGAAPDLGAHETTP